MQESKKPFSGEEYINALKDGNPLAFAQLYKEGYRHAEIFITKNSGTINDAEDVFQDALFTLIKNLRKSEFVLHVKPVSYILPVVKKMWLNQLRSLGKEPTISIDDGDRTIELAEEIEETNHEEHHYLFKKHFRTLGKDCQKVLTAFIEKKSMKEIAEMMGYTNVNYARLKKYRCTKELEQKIKEDPDFKNL